jgi:glycogen debranching enzyme
MPELHSGDPASAYSVPVPYPAACRPQAWSAASAVSVLASIAGLVAEEGGLDATPSTLVGPFTIDGVSFGGVVGTLSTDGDGRVAGSSLPLRSR